MAIERPYAILALVALTLVLALGTGFPLYFRLFFLLVLLLAGSFTWAFLNLMGVHVTAQRVFETLQVGKSLESRVTIHNSSPLPKLGIEIRDLPELPGHDTGAVFNLPSYYEDSRQVWKTPLRRRGVYTVGAPIVFSKDPFGIFRLRRREPGGQQIAVFPYMVEIPPFSSVQGEIIAEGTLQRNAPVASASVATVREYQPGESSRHVHWPSTAKKGSLMLKQFDSGMEDLTWVLLDLHREVHAGGQVENTEEYAITAVASIARAYSEKGWTVGLMAHGDRQYVLSPQPGALALDRILLALTEARAQGEVSLGTLLTLWHSQMASPAVSLVVVTPSVDPAWSPLLESLAQQGISATVVLIDPQSFGASRDPQLLLSQLHRRGIPSYLLRSGEDISQALQHPWRFSPTPSLPTGTDGANS